MTPLRSIRDRLNDWLSPKPVVKQPSTTEWMRRGVGWCMWMVIYGVLRLFAYFLKP